MTLFNEEKHTFNLLAWSDAEWDFIKPFVHHTGPLCGRPAKNHRPTLDAILFIAIQGLRWRDLPNELGSQSKVYNKFHTWSRANLWKNLYDKLQEHTFLPYSSKYIFEKKLDAIFAITPIEQALNRKIKIEKIKNNHSFSANQDNRSRNVDCRNLSRSGSRNLRNVTSSIERGCN